MPEHVRIHTHVPMEWLYSAIRRWLSLMVSLSCIIIISSWFETTRAYFHFIFRGFMGIPTFASRELNSRTFHEECARRTVSREWSNTHLLIVGNASFVTVLNGLWNLKKFPQIFVFRTKLSAQGRQVWLDGQFRQFFAGTATAKIFSGTQVRKVSQSHYPEAEGLWAFVKWRLPNTASEWEVPIKSSTARSPEV